MVNSIENRMDKYIRYIADRLTNDANPSITNLKIHSIPIWVYKTIAYSNKNVTDVLYMLKLVQKLNTNTVNWDTVLMDDVLYLKQFLYVPKDEAANMFSSIMYIINGSKDPCVNHPCDLYGCNHLEHQYSNEVLTALSIDNKDIIHAFIVDIDRTLEYGALMEKFTIIYVLSHSIENDLYDYFETLDRLVENDSK